MDTKAKEYKKENTPDYLKGLPERKKGRIDYVLLAAVLMLAILGLYMVLSTTYYGNLVAGVSPYSKFTKQAMFFGLGLLIMVLFYFMGDYVWIMQYYVALWIVAMVLLGAVFVLGSSANGAGRWIYIGGVSLQPSEFAKYMIIVSLAAFLHKHPRVDTIADLKTRQNREWVRFLITLALVAPPLLAIVLQKALSMTIVLALACMVLMACSGTDFLKLGIISAAGIGAAVFAIFKEPWRLTRIVDFVNWKLYGEVNSQGTNLQSVQSTYAFAEGGLFGKGLMASKAKLGFLPESETDFVFPIVGEEFGFIMVLIVIILYGVILARGIYIATHARTRFGGYCALGITVIFTLQALINMFVSTAILPVTGQALPLISQGGSSLVSHMAAMGMLLCISRETT